MYRKKRGFTIVEMLMVIAVLAVLMGIVSTAASSVIRKSRVRKNQALQSALQAGIATYYQQEGFWPPGKKGALQKFADNGLDQKDRGSGIATLDDSGYDALMSFLVTRCLTASGNKVMDVSGFTAVRKSATAAKEGNGLPKCSGEEVKSWVAKLKASNAHGSVPQASEMTFGYTHSGNGHFRRFVIKYNAETDTVAVEFAKDGK
jgi:prepilin-type N-terminal cleavage/methylation domain-containing protein